MRLEALGVHFAKPVRVKTLKPRTPESCLIARGQKGGEASGSILPIAVDDMHAKAITSRMVALNKYLLDPGRVDGIVFNGLKRIFNNADHPDFRWQWGGRFYSMLRSDRYESLKGGKTARASLVRLDGEPVVETDISASHLCILHGLMGLPFDGVTDPYDLGDPARREEAKWFITRAMGKATSDVGGKRYRWAREAALDRYPFLKDLGTNGIGTLDLQYHEAEIMMMAMKEARDRYGIGFLPMHDALMVPWSKRDVGAEVLRGAFRRYFTEKLGLEYAPVPRVH